MPCPICGKPLKKWFGLGGTSFIGCSDIKCNNKHVLRDLDGNELTAKQAIELLTNKS